MKVLSLCDGMSCGHIAIDMAGIEVEQYFAAEIKEIGIKVTKANYPDTIHIGDVNKISYKDGVLYTEIGNFEVGHIDLVIFGSPCQTFSIAIPNEQRVGLENLEKSGLFYECNRILKEVNPTYFLMENVRSMSDEDRDAISSFLGMKPRLIANLLVLLYEKDTIGQTFQILNNHKRKTFPCKIFWKMDTQKEIKQDALRLLIADRTQHL